jgi:hypothetical protein
MPEGDAPRGASGEPVLKCGNESFAYTRGRALPIAPVMGIMAGR